MATRSGIQFSGDKVPVKRKEEEREREKQDIT